MIFLKLLWVGATFLVSSEFYKFFEETAEGPPKDRGPESDGAGDEANAAPAQVDTSSAAPSTASAEPPAAADSGAAPIGVLATSQPVSEEQQIQVLDRVLGLASGALVMVGAGAFIHPALRLLSLPFLIAAMLPATIQAARSVRDEHRVSYSTLDVFQAIVELATGYIGLTTGAWLVFAGGQRLLLTTRRDVRKQLLSVFDPASDVAWLVQDGVEVKVRLDQVALGDLIAVHAGEPIPVDGQIVEGALGVDQRALTGESRLQELSVGDTVRATTVALSGRAVVRAEQTGNDTLAARVEALIAGSASYEQTLQSRVMTTTDRSVRPTLILAGYGLLTRGPVGLLGGLWTNTLDIAWLSSPTSMINTIKAAARHGILVKDGRSLEQLASVDTVVFDKTGTLTLDQFDVYAVHDCADALTRAEILQLAAALEGRQRHPIAQAIVEAASRDAEAQLPVLDECTYEVGYGIRAVVGGRGVVLGSARMLEHEKIDLAHDDAEVITRAEHRGHSLIYLAVDGRHAGTIELAPRVRPEARQLIANLRARGLEVLMLTGDDEGPSRALAESLGISRYYARTLPEEKGVIIERLRAEGRVVCFVGDGINDALALHRANVSVSMRGASSVAVESAQIVIQQSSLTQLTTLFNIGHHFAAEQRVIEGASLLPTAINVTGFVFAGFNLATVVGIYLTGFGVSLVAATLPRFQNYEDNLALVHADE